MRTGERVFGKIFENFNGHAYRNRVSIDFMAYDLLKIRVRIINKALEIISIKELR